MKQTINRIFNRIADRSTRLFAIAAQIIADRTAVDPPETY